MWPLFLILSLCDLFQNVACTNRPPPSSESGLSGSSRLVSDIILKGLKNCNLYVVLGNIWILEEDKKNLWLKAFESLASLKHMDYYSSGVINLVLYGNQTSDRLPPVLRSNPKFSISCSAIVLFLPSVIGDDEESMLTNTLAMPLLNPPTTKNLDNFIIVTQEETLISLYQSKWVTSLKYKLILTEDVEGRVVRHTSCSYCPDGPILANILTPYSIEPKHPDMNDHFPDLQTNYHGSTLKLSASNKISTLMEIEMDGNGKYIAKRGVYKSVLAHLVKKLNFTYEIVLSSGGGSTGHKLPNGTWVGTVGDAYSGLVDFGFMADVTYHRFSVVELCATINYAYLGFGTGPPAIIYTWKAIFWPFSGSMWTGMIVSVFLSSIFGSIFLKNGYAAVKSLPKSKKPVTLISLVRFYGKILTEQGEEHPIRSTPFRVFLGFWLLFAIVATTAYKSKIVSFMMFPVVEKVPHTFEELANSHFEIDFHYFGNVAYNLFKTSTSYTFVTMYQRMRKEPDPLRCVQKTMTSNSACIIFESTFERLKYQNVSDKIGNSPVRFFTHRGFMYTPGVIHEKKAALSANFRLVINTAREMGIIGDWQRLDFNQFLKKKNAWEQEVNKGASTVPDRSRENDDVLHLPNLIGSFTALGVGIALGLWAFIGENVYHKHQPRRVNPPIHRMQIRTKPMSQNYKRDLKGKGRKLLN